MHCSARMARTLCAPMARLLLAAAMLACAAECAANFPQPPPEPQPPPQPSYNCDRPDKIPAAERCRYIREQCESDSQIPYTEWYYCHVSPAGIVPSFFFTLLLAVLLPLLFTLLADTAEIYFSPIMTHVSQSVPKMRPRFAGVTFVAIGNGATDLSSNITAIRTGDVLLSAGALTGAAMFVQCIVAAEVMRASSGPVKCRGATLRDVGIYIVSVLMVLAAFAHGKITVWFVVGAVLLYLVYAVWVFVGDEWHERGRPEAAKVWHSFLASVQSRLNLRGGRQREDLLPWAMVDMGPGRGGSDGGEGRFSEEALTSPLVSADGHRGDGGGGGGGITSRPGSPGGAGAAGPHAHRGHRFVSAKDYQSMVWADLGPEEHGRPRGRRGGDGAAFGGGGGGGGGGRRRGTHGRQCGGRRKGPGGREDGGARGPTLELGQAGAGGANGYQPPQPPSDAGLLASGGGGSSQLLTLSSLDGSVLPAPAPVDAVPAAAASARGGTAGLAGRSPTPGASTTALAADAWAGGGSVGEYDTDSEDDEDDEEAGLLGARRGGGGGGGGDSDGEAAASMASSREAAARPSGIWGRIRYELTIGTSAEWDDLPRGSLRGRWRTITFPLLLPAYAAFRLTIPFVDPATYSRAWLIVTCVGAPLLFALYMAPGSWLAAVISLAAGGALAALVAYLTAGEEDSLPEWDLGTGFAFGPAFFAVFGFCVGIIWIGTLASEVVGIIALLASLLRIPSSVMGLTLLAWGNSLGDYFGNPAMARRGKPSMALTACFAGPLFNMLASMGLGFASYFVHRHVHSAAVVLRPEVALGCVFLALYNAAVAAAGLMNHGSLPDRFYLFARLWYGLYFVLACALGLWAGEAD